MAIVRRFNFSAPRLKLFAHYSSDLMVTTENLWNLLIEEELGKILSLYLDSTLAIIEIIFSKRKETGGTYSQLDKYKLMRILVPNLQKLEKSDVTKLLNLFEEVKDPFSPISFFIGLSFSSCDLP